MVEWVGFVGGKDGSCSECAVWENGGTGRCQVFSMKGLEKVMMVVLE